MVDLPKIVFVGRQVEMVRIIQIIRRSILLLHLCAFAALFVCNSATYAAEANGSPRLAIVISEASFEQDWQSVQMAAHGWTALSHLAGLPYDTYSVTELIASNLNAYSTLVFAQVSHINRRDYAALIYKLQNYIATKGSLIIDGPLALYDEAGLSLGDELNDILRIKYKGKHGGPDYRVRISKDPHFITKHLQLRQHVSQGLAGKLDILEAADGHEPQVIISSSQDSHAFLTAFYLKGARIVLISDLGTYSGPASYFRKNEPSGFYANLVLEPVLRSIYWATYGSPDHPFPAVQLTNAELAAVLRLDADETESANVQRRTLRFLIQLAKDTGAVPVYGWVSQQATEAGWHHFAALGKQLEDVGGEIGSHSKTHFHARHLDSELAKVELEGSATEIESNMNRLGYPIGKVDYFINPGIAVYMKDYSEIANRFTLHMTHGFQYAVPVGYGLTNWFMDPGSDLVVLENSAAGDYQWFGAADADFSAKEAATFQGAIFNHMFSELGRSVVFNQMWHDYYIGTETKIIDRLRMLFFPDHIPQHLLMYETMRERFMSYDIYFPTPKDLVEKLRASAKCLYDWHVTNQHMEITIDCQQAKSDSLLEYIGGMGIRIENSDSVIQSVRINEQPHYGFRDKLVILPNLGKSITTISIDLAATPSIEPRLIFTSKRTPVIRKNNEGLEIQVLTKSKAKFAFYAPGSYVLINADSQERDIDELDILRGQVNSDRQVRLKRLTRSAFSLRRADFSIAEFEENSNGVSFKLQGAGGLLKFRSSQLLTKIELNNKRTLDWEKNANTYVVQIPALNKLSEIALEFQEE